MFLSVNAARSSSLVRTPAFHAGDTGSNPVRATRPRWVRDVRLVGKCQSVVLVEVDRRWPGYWWARVTRRFVVLKGTLIAGGAIVRGPVHIARR